MTFNISKISFIRFITRILLPVVIIIFLIETYHFTNTRNVLLETTQRKNEIIINEVKTFQEFQNLSLDILEKSLDERLKNFSELLVKEYFHNTKGIERRDLHAIRQEIGMNTILEDIYIINSDGVIVNTTYKKDLNLNLFNFGIEHEEYLLRILHGEKFVSEQFAIENSTKKTRKYSYQPTKDHQYIIELGVYSKKADDLINFIYNHLHKLSLSDTTLKSVNLFIGADKPFSLFKETVIDQKQYSLLSEVFRDKVKYSKYQDERNPNIFYEYFYIPTKSSSLYKGSVIQIVTDKTADVEFLRTELLKLVLLALLISIIIVLVIIARIKKYLTTPIGELNKNLELLYLGKIEQASKLELKIADLKKLFTNYNNIFDSFKDFKRIITEFGLGNVNLKIIPKCDDDIISHSLINLQTSIADIEKKAKSHQLEEEQQNWSTTGLNKFATILRESTDDLVELGNEIVKNLVRYLNINQGGFFILNDDDKNDVHLELISTFAYDKLRHFKRNIYPGEGLVGMSVLEKYSIYRTEIPDDYINIDSGLGGSKPTSILIVPIMLEDEVFGALEMASFGKFEKYQIQFVEDVAESISYTLSKLKTNNRTQRLLEQSQKLSEEFEVKEKQLQTTISTLSKQNESLKTNEKKLIQQINRLQQNITTENAF